MSFERIKSKGVVGIEEELAKPKPGEVYVLNGGGVEGLGDGGGDGI